MLFISEEAKRTALEFSKGTVKVLWFYFISIQYKMTQYNIFTVKLFDSQLIKLKSSIKNVTEVTSHFSSNLIGISNDKTNFPDKLLLTNTWVSKIRKAFPNGSSANIKFSITQLHKIGQTEGKTGLPITWTLLKPLFKSILTPLGLAAASVSATDTTIQKKMFGCGNIALII